MEINFFQIHGFEAHIKIARLLMKTGRFEWSNDLKKITFLEKLPQKLVEIFFLIAKFFGKINFLCSLSNEIGKSILENSRVRIFVRFPLP